MTTRKQKAARSKFSRQAKRGTGKVGRRAKSTAKQRRKRQRHTNLRR